MYNACSGVGRLSCGRCRDHCGVYSDYYGQMRIDWRAPHEFLMDTTNMQFEVVPAGCHVVAGGIRTIEA